MQRGGRQLHARRVRTLQPPREQVQLQLEEKLVPGRGSVGGLPANQPCDLLSKAVGLRRVKLYPHSEGVGRPNWGVWLVSGCQEGRAGLTFDLFLDRFGGVDPVTDVVVVCVLQAEVILLDDVHLVVDLLHQLLTRRLLLQKLKLVSFHLPSSACIVRYLYL